MATIISAHGHRSIWSSLVNQAIPRCKYSDTVWATWRTRRQFRSDLKRLLRVGSYMIRDIGLSVEEVEREIKKPFWLA